jgi:sigma-B regulation protein RsbQ
MASAAIKEPGVAHELQQGICAIDPNIARQFAEVAFRCDLRALLPRCDKPTLVVQCTQDDIVSPQAAQYLAAHLQDASLRLLPAAGHCPQLTRPTELAGLIGDYLRSGKAAHV